MVSWGKEAGLKSFEQVSQIHFFFKYTYLNPWERSSLIGFPY